MVVLHSAVVLHVLVLPLLLLHVHALQLLLCDGTCQALPQAVCRHSRAEVCAGGARAASRGAGRSARGRRFQALAPGLLLLLLLLVCLLLCLMVLQLRCGCCCWCRLLAAADWLDSCAALLPPPPQPCAHRLCDGLVAKLPLTLADEAVTAVTATAALLGWRCCVEQVLWPEHKEGSKGTGQAEKRHS